MTRLSGDVFAIGDVHGHLDRLEALLEKAGTKDRDCTVILLGDLGHFGFTGTFTGDLLTWRFAQKGGVDYALWGNHDRAVVDRVHIFGGYDPPDPAVRHIMRLMEDEGRLLLAAEAHGWLLTHAGLHKSFKYNKASIDKNDPGAIAEWINLYKEKVEDTFGEGPPKGEWHDLMAVVDAVGHSRGGSSPYGGILWRDITEKLYGVPQVFGHSASAKHEVRGEKDQWWCVDIGGKGGRTDPAADCIAGIWLPSQEVVEVRLNDDSE